MTDDSDHRTPTPRGTDYGHVPVLFGPVLGMLEIGPGTVYADATAGLGGHAVEVATRMTSGSEERPAPDSNPVGRIVLNDLDPSNLDRAHAAVIGSGMSPDRVHRVHGSFDDLPRTLAGLNVSADAVLADLGFASTQVDDAARGLSFRRDGPLDMRFDRSRGTLTAAELIATIEQDELVGILRQYGEERFAPRIASKVVARREERPILTTGDLAELVRGAIPQASRDRIDPATRTFQALRIAVNDELGRLERLLRAIASGARAVSQGQPSWLAPGARVCIISFHSLEDRPVKTMFSELVGQGLAEGLSGKPVRADEAETAVNPRARSAKLRGIRLARPN